VEMSGESFPYARFRSKNSAAAGGGEGAGGKSGGGVQLFNRYPTFLCKTM
jgi:hypothetical protein